MKDPLFPVSMIFLAGIIAAAFFSASLTAFLVIVLFAALVILGFIRKTSDMFTPTVIVLVLLAGVFRYEAYNIFPNDHVKNFVSRYPYEAVVEGKIMDNPVFERRLAYFPELDFPLAVSTLQIGGKKYSTCGTVLVNAFFSGNKTLAAGDIVRLKGRLCRPLSNSKKTGFDYARYLEHKKIFAVIKVGESGYFEKIGMTSDLLMKLRKGLFSLKNAWREDILVSLGQPHAGILAAMLLGERQYFDKGMRDIFVRTGTMHIIAISGLHFTMIVFMLFTLFGFFKVPEKMMYVLVIIFIYLYSLMVGDQASVWRSAVMASAILFAFVIDRRTEILNILGFSLVVLLYINPNYIYDLGFILSYACVLSIIWLVPVTDRFLGADKKGIEVVNMPGWRKALLYVMKSISLSFAVWLGVFPILAYSFKLIAPITIVSNLIAVPVSFGMIITGAIAVVLKAFVPVIAIFFYETFWALDVILIYSMKWLSTLPGACFAVTALPLWCIIVYYLFLLPLIMYQRRRQGLSL